MAAVKVGINGFGRIGRNIMRTALDDKEIQFVAVNDVLYHLPERRPLQDVLTCIREGCTIGEAGYRLAANAERHLKPPQEMARLFRGREDAVERTLEIVERCRFSLDELRYEYPDESQEGVSPQQRLERLTWEGAAERVLHGFALSVLVPEGHYQAVSDWIGQRAETVAHFMRLVDQIDNCPLTCSKLQLPP